MSDLMLFRPPRNLSEEDESSWGFDAFWDFLTRYIPPEVIGELQQDEYETLYKAWDEASDADGVTQGE